MGTAGQRCTTLRRLFVHDSVYDALLPRLAAAWRSARVGDPLAEGTLVGPLIDGAAYAAMQSALAEARAAGGRIVGGEREVVQDWPDAWYVRPALVEMPAQTDLVCRETFAPILYVMRYHKFDEALRWHNAVPQGLASSIFTTDLREAERFVGRRGLGLRHRQREHRAVRGRDRRRVRRREGDRRRARVRVRRVEAATCAARPTRSTTAAPCRSPRGCGSTLKVEQRSAA